MLMDLTVKNHRNEGTKKTSYHDHGRLQDVENHRLLLHNCEKLAITAFAGVRSVERHFGSLQCRR